MGSVSSYTRPNWHRHVAACFDNATDSSDDFVSSRYGQHKKKRAARGSATTRSTNSGGGSLSD